MYLAKMTFNNNLWFKPSGYFGKLVSNPPHGSFYECDKGFGWEEWNFSPNRTLEDGYSYGFIQAVHYDDSLRGCTYNDVFLFTNFNNATYIIAYLKKLETLKISEGTSARTYFQNTGHVNSMRGDVSDVEGDIATFVNDLNLCINVKFDRSESNIKILWGNYPNDKLKINAVNKNFKKIFDISNDRLLRKINELRTDLDF